MRAALLGDGVASGDATVASGAAESVVEVRLPVAAKKPSVVLSLSGAVDPDGSPVWSECSVSAVRADGHSIDFGSVAGWSDLVDRLTRFMAGWPEKAADALERARSSAREVDRLSRLLDRARASQRVAARDAVASGVSVYRVAKTMGRSETAVKSWVSTPGQKAKAQRAQKVQGAEKIGDLG